MTEQELTQQMTVLYNSNDTKKNIIAKAVSLGMKYQEEKIKGGIEIVFQELHRKA